MTKCARCFGLGVVAMLALSVAADVAWAELPSNTLSDAEKRAGWRLLFDGRSADAFRGYKKDALGGGWVVEDGALVRRDDGAGDIVTKDEFGSFELQLEYRISPGGNSGVMFHVVESAAAPWMTGPEVQIIDNVAGHDPQKAGWLYGLYQPTPPGWATKMLDQAGVSMERWGDATRPAGEWNHLYLRVTEGGGEVCVNGVSYLKFKKGDKDWDARVAKSKFAKFPEFGKATRGHICLQDHGDVVAYRSIKIRALGGPPSSSSDRTAAVKAVPAFPGVTWEGWSPTADDGKPVPPLRPLVVTHAGDGSGRRFVLEQSGMIHVLAKDSVDARMFLDLRERVVPWKQGDEEGLLGLAFHPRFRENGEFFIRYCPKDKPRVRQVSRFRVRRDDPQRADPASEEVIFVNEQPFANHNGGSIAFGPDGYLYMGLGDGGGLNDLFSHGQNLSTFLGSILRIDVDRRDAGKAYAVPADNPFVGRADAKPEIYAYGFRNVWQMAFDPPTGRLWVADVGQDLLEEIDIVKKGGNYGWSVREGTKAFGRKAAPAGTIDPVWEYDHQVGKSITGGCVYRGKEIPELQGAYLYADYVSGKLWALQLDDVTGAATNMVIPWSGLPIFGFGSDEAGEVYVNTASPIGQGVFRLVRDEAAKEPAPGESSRSAPARSENVGHEPVGPIRVAEAGRAVVDILHVAVDALLADHVPECRRILAVDVPDLVAPPPHLRQRVDAAHDLVTRLPLEATAYGSREMGTRGSRAAHRSGHASERAIGRAIPQKSAAFQPCCSYHGALVTRAATLRIRPWAGSLHPANTLTAASTASSVPVG